MSSIFHAHLLWAVVGLLIFFGSSVMANNVNGLFFRMVKNGAVSNNGLLFMSGALVVVLLWFVALPVITQAMVLLTILAGFGMSSNLRGCGVSQHQPVACNFLRGAPCQQPELYDIYSDVDAVSEVDGPLKATCDDTKGSDSDSPGKGGTKRCLGVSPSAKASFAESKAPAASQHAAITASEIDGLCEQASMLPLRSASNNPGILEQCIAFSRSFSQGSAVYDPEVSLRAAEQSAPQNFGLLKPSLTVPIVADVKCLGESPSTEASFATSQATADVVIACQHAAIAATEMDGQCERANVNVGFHAIANSQDLAIATQILPTLTSCSSGVSPPRVLIPGDAPHHFGNENIRNLNSQDLANVDSQAEQTAPHFEMMLKQSLADPTEVTAAKASFSETMGTADDVTASQHAAIAATEMDGQCEQAAKAEQIAPHSEMMLKQSLTDSTEAMEQRLEESKSPKASFDSDGTVRSNAPITALAGDSASATWWRTLELLGQVKSRALGVGMMDEATLCSLNQAEDLVTRKIHGIGGDAPGTKDAVHAKASDQVHTPVDDSSDGLGQRAISAFAALEESMHLLESNRRVNWADLSVTTGTNGDFKASSTTNAKSKGRHRNRRKRS